MNVLRAIALMLWIVVGATAQVLEPAVEVYPAGPGRSSAAWKVEVRQSGQWVDAGCMQYTRLSVDPQYHGGNFPWVHWTTIGVSASADVRITRLRRSWDQSWTISNLDVRPTRYLIPITSQTSTTAEFRILSGQKLYIAVNGQQHDTLFIFANPPKRAVSSASPNVHYFGPGYHQIGVGWTPPAGVDTVYIDGGAWVVGTLNLDDKVLCTAPFQILGPGVLSGEFMPWEELKDLPFEEQYHWAMIRGPVTHANAIDVTIDGPTIVASPFINVALGGSLGAKTLRNVHVISPWTYNTDAFGVGSKADIDNCFAFNNDDTIHAEYIEDGSIVVRDSVFAGRNSFLCGYGYFEGGKEPNSATIERCDCILQDDRVPFRAEIDGDPNVNNGAGVVVENQVFKDIVIEGDVERLFDLKVSRTAWGYTKGNKKLPLSGNMQNVVFENIALVGSQRQRSVIQGFDQNNTIGSVKRPVIFRNVTINGIPVTRADFEINKFAYVVFQ
ncbi:MAG: hypothetical protein KDC95_15390 [Planctomycetes bacterium]|nr:hypothetical protein [Planctomycetota bacterium]